MTDDDLPKRPNAKYKLSKPDGGNITEESLTFHYNRERRLAKAPQAVRDLYAGNKKHSRFSLIRPLIADKPRATLFFVIIVLSGIILVLSILDRLDSSHLMDGNRIQVTGTRYEGATIVVLRKTLKNSNFQAYSGAVDIAISPVIIEDEDFPVFYHRIFFSLEPAEEYRFVVPFDSPELLMALQTERGALQFKFNTE